MTTPTVHEHLIAALRQRLGERATVVDAAARGSEQVSLLIDAGETAGDPNSGGRIVLHLILVSHYPLFWCEMPPRGKPFASSASSSGFADWLRLHTSGMRIADVSSGSSHRILRLDLVTPPAAAKETHLAIVLDPLANASRVLILDGGDKVQQRFPPPMHRTPTGRGASGELYKDPPAEYSEPWTQLFASSGDEAIVQPARLWLCVSPTGSVFLSPVSAATDPAEPVTVSGPYLPFEAARRAGHLLVSNARLREVARNVRQTLRAERGHVAKLRRRIGREIEEARGGGELRRQAEALLVHASQVPRGAEEVELGDPATPGTKILVRLDPARSFADNVKRLFRQAGRLERALPVRIAKAEQLDELVAGLDRWLEALAATDEEPSLRRTAEEVGDSGARLEPGPRRRWMRLQERVRSAIAGLDHPVEHMGYAARRAGGPRAATAREKPVTGKEPALVRAGIHPRRYELPGGWVVLVGRSNQENDVLTHKVARQRDIWLHARGVAGSHVVLQRGGHKDNPSRETLTQAAGIAAYYSKARTSRMVPVIYTEKRYVRKPRKAPPGLAVCSREKVLMVKPQVPPA